MYMDTHTKQIITWLCIYIYMYNNDNLFCVCVYMYMYMYVCLCMCAGINDVVCMLSVCDYVWVCGDLYFKIHVYIWVVSRLYSICMLMCVHVYTWYYQERKTPEAMEKWKLPQVGFCTVIHVNKHTHTCTCKHTCFCYILFKTRVKGKRF